MGFKRIGKFNKKRKINNENKENYKNRVVPKHFHDIPMLLYKERTLEIMGLKLDGFTIEEQVLYLQQKYGYTAFTSKGIVDSVYDEIKSIASENIEDILSKHLFMYEDIYRKACLIDNPKLQLKVLEAKEKLMGMTHDTAIDIRINNVFVDSEEEKKEISIELPKEKQKRLEYLLNKSGYGKIIDITHLQK